jgi:hypothetical protein
MNPEAPTIRACLLQLCLLDNVGKRYYAQRNNVISKKNEDLGAKIKAIGCYSGCYRRLWQVAICQTFAQRSRTVARLSP